MTLYYQMIKFILTLVNILIMFLKPATHISYLLTRIKIYLSLQNRILFYNSYILPHLDYCCIIWGSFNSVSEDKLITCHKRAARIILDKDYNTPSTELFTYLNWTTFHERVLYQKTIAMYKIVNNICPDYLNNHIAYTSEFVFCLSIDTHLKI